MRAVNSQTGAVFASPASSFHVSGRPAAAWIVSSIRPEPVSINEGLYRALQRGWHHLAFEARDLNVFYPQSHGQNGTGWLVRTRQSLLIGRPLCFGQDMMASIHIRRYCLVALPHHVPVIMDVDLGHLPPMMPLIVGSLADVTVSETISESDRRSCADDKQAERVISCRAHLNSRIPGSCRTLLLTPTCLLRC